MHVEMLLRHWKSAQCRGDPARIGAEARKWPEAKMARGEEKSRTQTSVRTFNSSSFLPTQASLIHYSQNALGFGTQN